MSHSDDIEAGTSSTPLSSDPFSAALGAISLYDPIHLTVHVPFSLAGRFACGCEEPAEPEFDRLAYVAAILEEVDAIADRLAGRGRVSCVTFGAGAPLALTPREAAEILSRIETGFGLTDDAELRLEADSCALTELAIEQYCRVGVTHVTLCEADQGPSSPSASPSRLARQIKALRQAGISRIAIAAPPVGGCAVKSPGSAIACSIGLGAGARTRIGAYSGRNPEQVSDYLEAVVGGRLPSRRTRVAQRS